MFYTGIGKDTSNRMLPIPPPCSLWKCMCVCNGMLTWNWSDCRRNSLVHNWSVYQHFKNLIECRQRYAQTLTPTLTKFTRYLQFNNLTSKLLQFFKFNSYFLSVDKFCLFFFKTFFLGFFLVSYEILSKNCFFFVGILYGSK